MAFQTGKRPVTTAAKGNAPNTGMPVTPAPTEDALVKLTKAKDVAWGRQQFGGNGYAGPVSTRPGETVMSDMAKSLKAKSAEGDAGDLLQDIIDGSNRRNDDLISSQLRKIDDSAYPVSSNMKRQQDPNFFAKKDASLPTSQSRAADDSGARRQAGINRGGK
ncbi:MAG: hypothetical protein ABSA90_06955 [Xanthobacteraceae bacterium]|jgi:hypothetical protein